MSDRLIHLSIEDVRTAVADHGDGIPGILPRMHMWDEAGKTFRRMTDPPPGVQARPAAVMLLFYPGPEGLTLVFTRRTDHLSHHAGQISFPGGRVDPTDASFHEAAEREAREELGIDTRGFELWGTLHSLYVPPSNHRIHPYVMYTVQRPHFEPNSSEVAEVLEIPLAAFLDPGCRTTQTRELEGRRLTQPCFRYGNATIWGATAYVLDQLLARIEAKLAADAAG